MKRTPIAALTLGTALALTACGGGSEEPDAGAPATSGGAVDAPAELTTVTVGVIPIVDVAPLYVGQAEGFFEEEGIELEISLAQGGAAIVPSVMSGEMDFGFSNLTSLIRAASEGLPLQVVSGAVASTGVDGEDFGGVLVAADSDIETAADLAGRTVAVNTLENINDSTVRTSVEAAGGDPDAVEFVEMPFPDMAAALEAGNVDAVQVVEPFLTISEQNGARLVASNYVDAAPDLTIAGFFTTTQIIESDPELVEAFTAALHRSLEFADANPDAVRAILPEYTEIDPAVIEELTLPKFPAEVNRESTQVLAELAGQPDVDLDALLP